MNKNRNFVYYFGYGANSSETRLNKRKVTNNNRKKARLNDYKIEFSKEITSSRPWKKGSAAATVVRDPGSHVEGFLYEISIAGLKKLDKAEGYPKHYTKVILPVVTEEDEKINAVVYFANETNLELLPCKKYVNTILENKEDLSDSYVKYLENIETFD